MYAYVVLFTSFSVTSLCRFLHNANTQYGWLAIPYPVRTCTSQETPNLLGAPDFDFDPDFDPDPDFDFDY